MQIIIRVAARAVTVNQRTAIVPDLDLPGIREIRWSGDDNGHGIGTALLEAGGRQAVDWATLQPIHASWQTAWAAKAAAAANAPSGPTLEQAKAQRREAVELAFATVRAAGVLDPTSGMHLQLREQDMVNVSGLVIAALGALTGVKPWDTATVVRMLENETTPVETPERMIELGSLGQTELTRLFTVMWQKKAEIDALDSIADVLAYDVTAGWGDAA